MKKLTKILCTLILLIPFAFCGCSGLTARQHVSLAYFGTETRIVVQDNFSDGANVDNFSRCWAEIEKMMSNVERAVSLVVENSDISTFNNAKVDEKIEISKITYEILCISQEYYALTNGAFNPAVGLLVDLWGFSPRFSDVKYEPACPYDRRDPSKELPDEKYIAPFVSLAKFDEVRLSEEDGRYYARKYDGVVKIDGVEYTMQLNLGGIAKGYACDRAMEIIQAYGYEYGYADFGQSSISLLADCRDRAGEWKIPLVSPTNPNESYCELKLRDTAISASGGYRQYYEIGGKRYTHIINPASGYPISEILSSTVVSSGAAIGDALSTAVCVMGKSTATDFIKNRAEKFMFITADGDGYAVTTNMPTDEYKLTGKSYHVAK